MYQGLCFRRGERLQRHRRRVLRERGQQRMRIWRTWWWNMDDKTKSGRASISILASKKNTVILTCFKLKCKAYPRGDWTKWKTIVNGQPGRTRSEELERKRRIEKANWRFPLSRGGSIYTHRMDELTYHMFEAMLKKPRIWQLLTGILTASTTAHQRWAD